jgi:hypothetical protein
MVRMIREDSLASLKKVSLLMLTNDINPFLFAGHQRQWHADEQQLRSVAMAGVVRNRPGHQGKGATDHPQVGDYNAVVTLARLINTFRYFFHIIYRKLSVR